MPDTKDIGRLYFHGFRYPLRGTPRIDRASTNEVEHPYRRGNGWMLRVGRYWAIAVGRWGTAERDEDEALLAALEGEEMDVEAEVIRQW
jgi:hypothetical protein